MHINDNHHNRSFEFIANTALFIHKYVVVYRADDWKYQNNFKLIPEIKLLKALDIDKIKLCQ